MNSRCPSWISRSRLSCRSWQFLSKSLTKLQKISLSRKRKGRKCILEHQPKVICSLTASYSLSNRKSFALVPDYPCPWCFFFFLPDYFMLLGEQHKLQGWQHKLLGEQHKLLGWQHKNPGQGKTFLSLSPMKKPGKYLLFLSWMAFIPPNCFLLTNFFRIFAHN